MALSTFPDGSAVEGCLVGQAIGDMMGLPFENLSPKRVARIARFDRPSLLFGFGCGSDDTEHLGLTAEALQVAQGDVEVFRRRLASGLRRWFLAGPPGIGLATLKACMKLCLGMPSRYSGVRSAGNGPAMRAAILGVMVPAERLHEFNSASCRITHTDPRAEIGSLIVARLAAVARTIRLDDGPNWIDEQCREFAARTELGPLTKNLRAAAEALRGTASVLDFAQQLTGSRGVSGFIAHTVPVAVFAFFRHADDYAQGVEQVIRAGGDTDTVAAITGALIGTRVGIEGIPQAWRDGYRDWPWTLRRLLQRKRPALLLWPFVVMRNLAFFLLVLGHLVRRVFV